MANEARFWDNIADKYSKKPVPSEEVYNQKLELTKEILSEDMSVFEFGCGTGTTALNLAPYVKNIWATDFSENMIEIARAKGTAQDVKNVTFDQMSIEDVELEKGAFDVIMGHSILHLVEDKEAMLAKVFASLKPGGAFVTSTACIQDFLSVFKYVAPMGKALGLLPLVKVFSQEDFMQALKDAGFEIEHEWLPNKWAGVFVIARKPVGARSSI